MRALELLKRCLSNDIQLYLEQGEIKISGNKEALTTELVEQLREKKHELRAILQLELSAEIVRIPRLTAAERQQPLPLSFAQQRLWFIDQLAGGSVHYNLSGALTLSGKLNHQALQTALDSVIARHEVLRTVFSNENGEGRQNIQASTSLAIAKIDLSQYAPSKQQERCQQIIQQEVNKGFDLSQDWPLRVSVILLSAHESVLLLTMHHIASDGWSMGILIHEFGEYYQASVNGQAVSLTPLSIQYADYALWQRAYLQGAKADKQLDYWRGQLADIPIMHDLPLDFARPSEPAYQGGWVTGQLSTGVSASLLQLAKKQGVTLFMLLHSGFSLLLSRYSHSGDIVIGTPVANRLHKKVEPLIGFFVNTLVLRSNCEGCETYLDYLQHIKQVNLEAQNNQDIPFEHLVEELHVPRSAAHMPLVQILFSMNTNRSENLELAGLTLSPLDREDASAKVDLTLEAKITEGRIGLQWIYDKALFKGETIERFNRHLCTLLTGIATDPQIRLSQLPMLSEQEITYLTHALNDTQVDYPQDKLIHELFQEQAEKTPDNVALVFEQQTLSYQQLNEQANQLAHYLREQGIQSESLVGICVERSLEMVIGLLAILKAGGAYVPLDPAYPQARLEYMLKDSQVHLLMTQSDLLKQFQQQDIECIAIDEMQALLATYRKEAPIRDKQLSSSLAYVIYTSGSTGEPKGVLIEHQSIVNLIANQTKVFCFSEDEKAIWLSSYVFDASVEQLFLALTNGAELIIPTLTEIKEPELIKRKISQSGVTHLHATPSYLHVLGEIPSASALKRVISGGEACISELRNVWGDLLINKYGPTETTVTSVQSIAYSECGDANLIGKPIANTCVYLLSKNQAVVPVGVVGELYIGGVGLARGYLNRPELTAERFIQSPFSGNPEDRLYRTGDWVRYVEGKGFSVGKELAFIGRVDEQVKIRGFRIELGEIEQQLLACEVVASCVVLAREEEPGQKQLVAYVVTEQAVEDSQLPQTLRKYLKARLPDYMLPSWFVILDELPLTPNGKIDRKALSAADGSLLQGEYVAPVGEIEHTLVGIWVSLLKLDASSISATANFFELGGHSLLSIRLLSDIRSQLGVELKVRQIFEWPQLADLAALIEKSDPLLVRPPITAIKRLSNQLPVSFAQQRLWFIDQMEGGSSQYNMPMALLIKGDFDESIAELAFQRIIQRHEPLRTVRPGSIS